ncbi:hypothetical protein KPL71_022065 [Citrus sinensis]|uniref:Uncharacterized protein n=1 Tax=Citrus sinensis TaxID=2711 RepID=A0ACB8JK67_CITSI|nr:hypothetical protein KPL71_022065 [Citrus sinensis]
MAVILKNIFRITASKLVTNNIQIFTKRSIKTATSDVQIISTEAIKPSSPTPKHLRTYKLSLPDQLCSKLYVPLVFFYSTNCKQQDLRKKSDLLKQSLAKSLTHYYPFAGRLIDSFSVDCNDHGAAFIEANVGCDISKFLQPPDMELLQQLIPPSPQLLKLDIFERELLAVQVNLFSSSEMAIGVCFYHGVADGSAIFNFMKMWGEITRGVINDNDNICNNNFVLDCTSLFPPVNFPQPYQFTSPQSSCNIVFKRFLFDGKKIDALKEKMNKELMGNNFDDRLYMKRKLYTFSMKEGTTTKDYLDEFNKLILDLEKVNVMLEDEDRALILLSSLPDSYEHFVDTLLYGRQTLTLKDVKNALESKDLKKRSDLKYQVTGDGLVVKEKSEKKVYKDKKNKIQRENDDKKKKKMKCYFCQKEGHYIKDCFEKKKLEKLQKDTNGKAAIASEDEEDAKGTDVLIAAEKQPTTEWILDSGCSFHMCPNKEFFKTFESITSGKVFLGNNLACKVTGIGTINIQMFDGRTRELKEVSDKTKLWHMRLGHISQKGMKELEKQGLFGHDQITQLEFCEKCVFGKATRLKFNTGKHETKQTLDYIHSDIWGPSQIPSHGGARYFITFIDDYSMKLWVYILKHKSEALDKFKEWTALMENQIGRKVKRLRTDNGLEYCSNEFDEFCRKMGIARHKTVRNTPQQNGLAERMNRTLIEKLRCMLLSSNLSKHFWPEAVVTAAYLINRSLTSALEFRTPQEAWSGKPLDLSNLKVFGCPAYAHIRQGKLEPRVVKGYFIGYPEGIKGYKIWSINGKPTRTFISRDVVFDEEALTQSRVETEITNPSSEEKEVVELEVEYGVADLISYALVVAENETSDEPATYKKAMRSKDKRRWVSAMEEEMASLNKNKTWTLVKKPADQKLVGCKWIYKIKKGVSEAELASRNKYDSCVYFKTLPSGNFIYLLLYVDDMLLACKQRKELKWLKDELSSEFEMKNLGPATKILGMHIIRDRNSKTLFLSQTGYVEKVLGRPDLAYGIGVLSRFMSNPRKHHWLAAKWMLRYLKGTVGHGIIHGRVGKRSDQIQGYVNSDFAGDLDKRRSITGYVYTLCGGAVS